MIDALLEECDRIETERELEKEAMAKIAGTISFCVFVLSVIDLLWMGRR